MANDVRGRIQRESEQYLEVVSQLPYLLVLPLGALRVPVFLDYDLTFTPALVLRYRPLREFERLLECAHHAHVVSKAHRRPQGRIHARRELRVPDHPP